MTETTTWRREAEAPIGGMLAGRALSASSSGSYAIGYSADAPTSNPSDFLIVQGHRTIIADAYSLPETTKSCGKSRGTIPAHTLLLAAEAHTDKARNATRALDRLKGRLREFKFLPPNWNGYGGMAPSPRAVEDCVTMLDRLGTSSILPSPTVAGDGEVGLFWEQAGVTVEIGCRGDGRYGYLVELPDGAWAENEGVPLQDLHPAIVTALEALTTA